MTSKHSHPLAPCSAPCSRFCIVTEAVPFVSSLPRACHTSANLPRDASQAHSCRRAVALVFSRSALSYNLSDIRAACAHIVSRTRTASAWRASIYPGLTILEILGVISLDRCLDFRSLLRLAPPSTRNSTLFLPTNREPHAVFLLLARAVSRFRSRPTLKLSTL
jgi:hypothetical protein